MRMRSALVLLYALGLFGCDSNPTSSSVKLDYSFALAMGDSALVQSQSLQITFEQVVSDSRCPTGAVCVAAGEGVIRISLTKASVGRETRDLKTTPVGSEATYSTYRITLVTLDPYPTFGQPVPTTNYVAILRVTQP